MKAIVNGNPSALRARGPVAQGATGWGVFKVTGHRLQVPVNGGGESGAAGCVAATGEGVK